MHFKKANLWSVAAICAVLVVLAVLYLLGRSPGGQVTGATGLIKAAEAQLAEVTILTGVYAGQTAEIPLSESSQDRTVGDTVALEVTRDGGGLNAHLSSGYVEYESGHVTQILTDSCQSDQMADGAYRGEQTLIVSVSSGQYANTEYIVCNVVGPIYNQPLAVGDPITVSLSTDADGNVTGTVYEYARIGAVWIVLALFAFLTVLVGGKVGLRSLLGLAATVGALLFLLLPLLLKGWPTLPTTFLLCALVTVLSLVLLGGVQKKTVCAILGTLSGMALALAFAMLAQALCRIDGLRMEYAEALLQLRQSGESAVGIRNVLSAGVMVSALGAVMDVAMSLSSSLSELHRLNPTLSRRQLWGSGMRIARDMVGTMTNTLVLAIVGSELLLLLYLCSLNLAPRQLLSSSYLALELISSVASSVGILLAVPLTVLVNALVLKPRDTTG